MLELRSSQLKFFLHLEKVYQKRGGGRHGGQEKEELRKKKLIRINK